jgi:hypothetical protein
VAVVTRASVQIRTTPFLLGLAVVLNGETEVDSGDIVCIVYLGKYATVAHPEKTSSVHT